MTIPVFDRIPSTLSPDTFGADWDDLLSKLNAWGAAANALAVAMQAVAAGGAVSLQYVFSSATADVDPGAGLLCLNNATQNASTVIRADLTGADGSDLTGVLDLLDDSTSTNKGYLRLMDATTPTKWILFYVTALASPSGYRNISATVVASTSASPFTNGDSILLDFSPTGDKGDQGIPGVLSGTAAGTVELLTGTAIASAATINLDTATGNRVHITGTAAITAVTLTRGPRTVVFDGILTLTHHATTNNLPGAANITTAAGDRAIYESDGTAVYCISYTKASGAAVVSGGLAAASQAQAEAGTADTVAITPLSANWHPGAAKAWLRCGVAGNVLASHNITSITDTGTGRVTVTLAVDFSSVNYSICATLLRDTTFASVTVYTPDAGSFQLSAAGPTNAETDPLGYFVTCFGDQ